MVKKCTFYKIEAQRTLIYISAAEDHTGLVLFAYVHLKNAATTATTYYSIMTFI
jgi:hypothetical protein